MSNKINKLEKKLIKQLSKEFGFVERKFLNKGLYHSTAAIVGKINIDKINTDIVSYMGREYINRQVIINDIYFFRRT